MPPWRPAEALALRAAGHDVVVVHGAGPQITAEMERRGIAPTFVDGRRVTTAEVLEVVRASLAEVNREVCAAIGPDAVSLFGDEIGLRADAGRRARARRPSRPVRRRAAIADALAAGRIPVVAPLAEGAAQRQRRRGSRRTRGRSRAFPEPWVGL